jgi:hypothetical protein
MFGKIKGVLIVAVIGWLGYSFLMDSNEQSADLGAVLDRSVLALEKYDEHLTKNNITEAGPKQMDELTGFMGQVMNTQPFYDKPLGVDLGEDAKFTGWADENGNGIREEGEGDVFTVEVDSEKKRLIATDTAGNASDTGFSGTGFLAGALIGSLLARQARAGIQPGSFNNRKTTPRSAYKSPASARSRARSGGLGKGK